MKKTFQEVTEDVRAEIVRLVTLVCVLLMRALLELRDLMKPTPWFEEVTAQAQLTRKRPRLRIVTSGHGKNTRVYVGDTEISMYLKRVCVDVHVADMPVVHMEALADIELEADTRGVIIRDARPVVFRTGPRPSRSEENLQLAESLRRHKPGPDFLAEARYE